MPWAPAKNNGSCAECLAIARELNEAYSDGPLETGLDASRKSMDAEAKKAASEALRSLIGGTEEDADRADELLSPYRYQPQHHLPQVPPVAMAALRRSAQHAARTGHFLSRVSH